MRAWETVLGRVGLGLVVVEWTYLGLGLKTLFLDRVITPTGGAGLLGGEGLGEEGWSERMGEEERAGLSEEGEAGEETGLREGCGKTGPEVVGRVGDTEERGAAEV